MAYFKSRTKENPSGFQRSWNKKKSSAIADFLKDDDVVLPNTIIIDFRLNELNINETLKFEDGYLSIPNVPEIAYIIDGQHRLRAFEQIDITYDLIVTAFQNISLSKIAEIFVQINFNQKQVNKSLVFDLLSVSPEISEKYAKYHEITEKSNSTVNSPWLDKIKMLGTGQGIISQATFVQAMEENKILDKVLNRFNEKSQFTILWTYFEAMKITFPQHWCNKKAILCRSVGFHAQMKFLPYFLDRTLWKTRAFRLEQVKQKLLPLRVIDFSDESIKRLGGKAGANVLCEIMQEKLGGQS